MTAALLTAIIQSAPAVIALVLQFIADIKASGHPPSAPLTDAHLARIGAIVAAGDPNGAQTFDDPDGGE